MDIAGLLVKEQFSMMKNTAWWENNKNTYTYGFPTILGMARGL